MAAFPPISSLIPHEGPSCLLEAVLRSDRASTECSAQIDAEHPYVQGGSVHALLAIELFAQSAAVHRSLWDRLADGAVASGRLVGANIRVHGPRLLPPSSLLVRVVPTATFGALHSYGGKLYLADELLAEGDVSVSVAEDAPDAGDRTDGGRTQ